MGLSISHFVAGLQHENESLRANLQELELHATLEHVFDSTSSEALIQSYLQDAVETAKVARSMAQTESERIKTLETALKISESKLKSEGLRRVQILADLDENE